MTPAFSALVADLLPKYLDPELYTVINGAIPETTKVSYLRLRGVNKPVTIVVGVRASVGS
jgi:hypothetical protein